MSIVKIEEEIEKILNLKYMQYFREEISKIIDGDNEELIIENLNNFLFLKKNLNIMKKFWETIILNQIV